MFNNGSNILHPPLQCVCVCVRVCVCVCARAHACVCVWRPSWLGDCGKAHLSIRTSSCAPGKERGKRKWSIVSELDPQRNRTRTVRTGFPPKTTNVTGSVRAQHASFVVDTATICGSAQSFGCVCAGACVSPTLTSAGPVMLPLFVDQQHDERQREEGHNAGSGGQSGSHGAC